MLFIHILSCMKSLTQAFSNCEKILDMKKKDEFFLFLGQNKCIKTSHLVHPKGSGTYNVGAEGVSVLFFLP